MELPSKLAYGADYSGVSWNTSLDHIRKDFHDRLVECEVLNRPLIFRIYGIAHKVSAVPTSSPEIKRLN